VRFAMTLNDLDRQMQLCRKRCHFQPQLVIITCRK